MKFIREGNNMIRCVISEEEMQELGYTIEDIIGNGIRTQQFINHIFDLAEKEFNTKFEVGLKSVRADIMPDHTISLTFSEHPGVDGVMDHFKDMVNGLLHKIPKKKWDEIRAEKEAAKIDKTGTIIVLFAFDDLDILMRYAKQVSAEEIPFNQLYKFEGIYFLMLDMTESHEADVRKLSALTDEYAADVFIGAEKRAFIYEHGEAILKERAIEQLKEV
ncbi:MAG: adaptor protein MecA [Agathobacter sp.]|nr:adaptor protein MecA [Agathobacter sp.]